MSDKKVDLDYFGSFLNAMKRKASDSEVQAMRVVAFLGRENRSVKVRELIDEPSLGLSPMQAFEVLRYLEKREFIVLEDADGDEAVNLTAQGRTLAKYQEVG